MSVAATVNARRAVRAVAVTLAFLLVCAVSASLLMMTGLVTRKVLENHAREPCERLFNRTGKMVEYRWRWTPPGYDCTVPESGQTPVER